MNELLQVFLLCSLSLMDCKITEIPAETGPVFIFCPASLQEMENGGAVRGSLEYRSGDQQGVFILSCAQDS